MKLLLFILFIITIKSSWSQNIEVKWNNDFRKELHFSCQAQDFFCEKMCQAMSSCIVEEGICRNCIGTGLKLHHLFTELGKTILSSNVFFPQNTFIEIIRSGHFAAFSPKDAYNVIDAFGSLSVLKKFEALCPDESISQIIFVELDKTNRSIVGPQVVYCEYPDKSLYFKVRSTPDFSLEERNRATISIPIPGVFF